MPIKTDSTISDAIEARLEGMNQLLLPTTQTILRTSFIWRYRQIENSLKTN
jgi:hypothetical protein